MARPQASLSSKIRLDCHAVGGPKRRVWHKIHLWSDEETLAAQAVEITGSHIGDTPILPDLRDQIPQHQEIGSVTADGAYDTRNCHDAIADCGAHAVIPPRKNAKPWKTITAGAVARNEALRAAKYLGRALWRRWSGYRRRSRFEANPLMVCEQTLAGQWMHCGKLLDQRLMAWDFDRQIAELQVSVAVLNGFTALGIPFTEAVR
jgi:transposase